MRDFSEGGIKMEFDYYNSTFSYMKVIMEELDRYNIEKLIIEEVFNTFLNRKDASEIEEIVIYSSLFENKINKLDENSRKNLLNDLYNNYIKNIILNFSNNDVDAVIVFFDELQGKIKSISGYYGLFGDNGYFNHMEEKLSNRLSIK